jgi:hypothetical protein
MFEDCCLACGRVLRDDGYVSFSFSPLPPTPSSSSPRPYCSGDDCHSKDSTSPSVSSTSSAYSSPNFGYATGGDVPPLLPSALGYAFSTHTRDRNSISSSSASSTAWSLTDEDEDDSALAVYSDREFDSSYDGIPKSPHYTSSNNSSQLFYARLPSGTNNRNAYTHLHHRTSSSSFSAQSAPKSIPIRSPPSTEDEASFSDGLSSREDDEELLYSMDIAGRSTSDYSQTDDDEPSPRLETKLDDTLTKKTKRSQNRASLPAYFSLLQMPSNESQPRNSMASSGQTITAYTRHSPATPKLSLSGLSTSGLPMSSLTAPPTAVMHSIPRGRRRTALHFSDSRTSSRDPSGRSSSRSRPRTRARQSSAIHASEVPFQRANASTLPVAPHDAPESSSPVFDWALVSSEARAAARGRTIVRRNSSPPPAKVTMSAEDFSFEEVVSRQQRGNSSPTRERKSRGRYKVTELDGMGGTVDAPGFGHGRSGLLDREHRKTERIR